MTDGRELDVRLSRLKMLVDLALHALTETDLPMLYKESVITAAAGLDADSASVFCVTDDNLSLRLAASSGAGTQPADRFNIPLDARVPMTEALRGGEPLLVGELARDTRFGDAPALWDREIESVIAVPIPGRDRSSGVLSVVSNAENKFRIDDLEFAQSVVRIIARSVQRHRLIRRLKGSEEYYRNLIENASDLIAVINPEGRVGFVSPASRRILGREPAEIVGHDIDEFIHPDDRLRARAHLLGALDLPGEPGADHLRMLHRDGSFRIVEAIASGFKDSSGRVVLVVNIRDVTDKGQAEENLHRAIARAATEWQETFDSISSPIFILDAAEVVQRANTAARRLTGRPFSKIVGTPLENLGTGRFWKWAAAFLVDARSGVARGERQIEDSDTGRTWTLSVSRFDDPGAAGRLVLLARDISPLVELQETLRRSETMSAMAAIVGGIAHSIRNPLFAVSATLDAFDARFGSRDEYRRYATALREQLDRMNKLMGDLLEFSKPITLELAEIDPATVLREAADRCATLAAERDVRLRIESASLPKAEVDAPRLALAVANLIQNSIEQLPPAGEVRVTPDISVRANSNWLRIRVEDNGPGFRTEDLPLVFQPFFSRRPGGTGLGLSTARRIVEEHGGVMEAANRQGGGAVVTVSVPLRPRSAALAPGPAVGHNPSGRA